MTNDNDTRLLAIQDLDLVLESRENQLTSVRETKQEHRAQIAQLERREDNLLNAVEQIEGLIGELWLEIENTEPAIDMTPTGEGDDNDEPSWAEAGFTVTN